MKKFFSIFSLLVAFAISPLSAWAATYTQLTSIANIDEKAKYVLGIDGTGYHYQGTSSWGKTALPSAQTPISYTLKKANDGKSFTAQATISGTTYYLQVPTSNTFSMATSTGTNTDLIIGTTQVSGTNYAVANKTTTTRHLRINGTSGLRSYAGTTGTMAFFYKVEDSSTPEPTVCDEPTFSPNGGDFIGSTTVTLTTTTEGASIYYTKGTNPANPTTSSTLYNGAITVDATTTIKAIAVKDGLDNSTVASATFTKVEPLSTMDAIFAAATTAGNTATDCYVTFNNWIISGASSKNVYVTDGTKGFIIYANNHGFAVGDILSGTVACKVQLYNGAAELTTLTSNTQGLTVTTGGEAPINELDAAGIDALSGVNTGSLIKISGECTSNNNKFYIAGVQLYSTLFTYQNPIAGNNYNCTGVYVQYNQTKEMLPRSAADIEEIVIEGAPEAPTFTPEAGTYTSVQNVTISCATQGASIYYTTDGTTPTENSTAYSSAISVDKNMTIKAIAIKNDKSSTIASAAYVINLPEDETKSKTWDLSKASYDNNACEDKVTWSATYVTMTNEKGNGTAANNYLGGDANNRTSSRFYKDNILTITPTGKQITTITFVAASASYATALANSTWTNATATASESNVIVTAKGNGEVSATIGATCGFTKVRVEYEDIDTSIPANPSFSLEPGLYEEVKYVELSCDTEGATIYYTTNGEKPTSASSVYTTAIAVGETMTIKAIAIKEGKSSSIVSAEYIIEIDSRHIARSPKTGFTSVSGEINNHISFAAYKGGGTAEPNIKDNAIQLYQKGSGNSFGGYITFSAVKGCKIDQIKVLTAKNATNITYSVDDGDLQQDPSTIASGAIYETPAELNAQSVNIYCMHTNSNNRLFVSQVYVYYIGEPITIDHLVLSGEYETEFTQGDEFNHTGLVVEASYNAQGSDKIDVTAQAEVSTPDMYTVGEKTVTVSYGGKAATYTINVAVNTELDDLTGTWALVTEESQLSAGKKIIIAEAVESNGEIKTMGVQKNNNREAVASTVENGRLTPNIATKVFTLVDAGDGKFALQGLDNKYLYAASSSSNNLKSQDEIDGNASWEITIAEDKATITAIGENTRNTIRFNSNNSLFSCYASGQSDIALYVMQQETEPELNFEQARTGLAVNSFYTICMPKNILAIRGASFWSLSNRATDGSEVYFEEAVAPFEAGKPYIFYTSATILEVAYGDDEALTPGVNGALHGTFANMLQDDINEAYTNNSNSPIYIIAQNKMWQVANNTGNSLGANRAYIVYNDLTTGEPAPAPGRRVIAMPMKEDTATDINNLNVGTTDAKKVVVNGQFLIIREGKVYNATGCVVKE